MVKNLPTNAGGVRLEFDPWVGKIPWRRAWHPTPVFLPGESPWTEEPGGLQSIGSVGCTNTQKHWKMKDPKWSVTIRSQRVGHDWSDLAQQPLTIWSYCFSGSGGTMCISNIGKQGLSNSLIYSLHFWVKLFLTLKFSILVFNVCLSFLKYISWSDI